MILQLHSSPLSTDILNGDSNPILELVLIFTVSFFISRAIRDKLFTPKAAFEPITKSNLSTTGVSHCRSDALIADKIVSMCSHKFEQALDLYNCSRAVGSFSSFPTLDRITRALCVGAIRAGKPQLVFNIVRDFVSSGGHINPDLVASITKSCTAKLYHKECLALYDQLFDRKAVDHVTLSCLLFSAVEADENWRARKLFKEIDSPSVSDVNNFMRACCARSDFGTAFELYDTISEPDPDIVAILASSLINAGQFQLVEGLLGRDGGRLSATGVNEILFLLATSNISANCAELLRTSRNFELTDKTFVSLVSLFRCEPSLLSLLYNRGSASSTNLAISALVMDGCLHSALRFIEMSSDINAPSQEIIESLILAFADRGDILQAVNLVDIMIARHFRPNESILTSMLLCCKSNGCDWSIAQSIFRRFNIIGMDPPPEALEVVADMLPIDEDLVNELCKTMNEERSS